MTQIRTVRTSQLPPPWLRRKSWPVHTLNKCSNEPNLRAALDTGKRRQIEPMTLRRAAFQLDKLNSTNGVFPTRTISGYFACLKSPYMNKAFGRLAVFAIGHETECPSRIAGRGGRTLAVVLLASIASLWPFVPALRAEEESCASCGQQVSVNGDFAHRKDDAAVTIQGATNNAAAFHEDINGTNFTVAIAHLPEGKIHDHHRRSGDGGKRAGRKVV